MYQVIIVIHVLLGLGVVGLVLMQQGKGADAGAAFGSGSSASVFGAQGAASFLSRATAILATLFFTTSLGLAILNSQKGGVNDLIVAPKAQQEGVAVPSDTGSKIAEDIPAQGDVKTEEVPVSPAVPAVIAPAASVVVPAAENLNGKPEDQVKEEKHEPAQDAPIKEAEKKSENASKPAVKAKVVKKNKQVDSKPTKKAEKLKTQTN